MSCPPGRRAARKADRRRAILEVAERSFLERGFADTSMSTIAAELGGSKTTLWTYFPSKDELFRAVLDTKVAEFQRELDEALVPTGGTEAVLNRFGRVLIRKILSPLSIAVHRLIVAEADRFPWIGKLFAERGPDRVRAHLARYLEQEMQAGRLCAGDPLLAARQFIALCQAGFYAERLWRTHPDLMAMVDPEVEVPAAIATFMAAWGLRPR